MTANDIVLGGFAHFVFAGAIRMAVGLPALALLCVPVVYIVMALRAQTWEQLYKTAVPHLV